MACSTCKNRSTPSIPQQIVQVEQDCIYTFEEISNKYSYLSADPVKYAYQLAILKSALNFYSSECNRYVYLLNWILNIQI